MKLAMVAVEKSKNQGLVVCDSSPDFSGDSTGLGLSLFFFSTIPAS